MRCEGIESGIQDNVLRNAPFQRGIEFALRIAVPQYGKSAVRLRKRACIFLRYQCQPCVIFIVLSDKSRFILHAAEPHGILIPQNFGLRVQPQMGGTSTKSWATFSL